MGSCFFGLLLSNVGSDFLLEASPRDDDDDADGGKNMLGRAAMMMMMVVVSLYLVQISLSSFLVSFEMEVDNINLRRRFFHGGAAPPVESVAILICTRDWPGACVLMCARVALASVEKRC